MNISTEYDIDYAYDTYGRLSSVVCPLSSETFTYSYLANSNLVSGITYPNNISVTKSYEPNRDLVTLVANKYSTTTLSQYGYTYDDLGRRQDMAKSGTAFSASDTINYGYNDKSEVTSAIATNDTNYNFGFNFDPIGNRLTSSTTETGSTVTKEYSTNNLNQYTAITNPSQSPTYDEDGNMLTMTLASGSWTNTWNGENRLIETEKSDAKLDFLYDYMGRRVRKQVYSGSTGSWSLASQLKFVYDGYKLIEELDGQNSDAIIRKYVWSGETPVSFTDVDGTFYYLLDANKNVTDIIDSTGANRGHYEYSPFGKITKMSGDKADDNPIRFSSEYADSETGLIYYNFRYYSPELGRWVSRDPIGEEGSYNFYSMCSNDSVNHIDHLGLVLDWVEEKAHDWEKVNDSLVGQKCSPCGASKFNILSYKKETIYVRTYYSPWYGDIKIFDLKLINWITGILWAFVPTGGPPNPDVTQGPIRIEKWKSYADLMAEKEHIKTEKAESLICSKECIWELDKIIERQYSVTTYEVLFERHACRIYIKYVW